MSNEEKQFKGSRLLTLVLPIACLAHRSLLVVSHFIAHRRFSPLPAFM
jgi:hypothetical protein